MGPAPSAITNHSRADLAGDGEQGPSGNANSSRMSLATTESCYPLTTSPLPVLPQPPQLPNQHLENLLFQRQTSEAPRKVQCLWMWPVLAAAYPLLGVTGGRVTLSQLSAGDRFAAFLPRSCNRGVPQASSFWGWKTGWQARGSGRVSSRQRGPLVDPHRQEGLQTFPEQAAEPRHRECSVWPARSGSRPCGRGHRCRQDPDPALKGWVGSPSLRWNSSHWTTPCWGTSDHAGLLPLCRDIGGERGGGGSSGLPAWLPRSRSGQPAWEASLSQQHGGGSLLARGLEHPGDPWLCLTRAVLPVRTEAGPSTFLPKVHTAHTPSHPIQPVLLPAGPLPWRFSWVRLSSLRASLGHPTRSTPGLCAGFHSWTVSNCGCGQPTWLSH